MLQVHSDHVETFECLGCRIRLTIGPPARPGLPAPNVAATAVRAWIQGWDRRLSRFNPGSETARLNRDARRRVPASPALRSLVGAGVWAAQRSGGLVDPTLLHAVEDAGYDASYEQLTAAPLAAALAAAPRRRRAWPAPQARWREFRIDNSLGLVERPPGIGFDPGGVGRGLAVDAVATQLQGYSYFVIDCGGDIRMGGVTASWARYFVNVHDPRSGAIAWTLPMNPGAVATSSLAARLWRRADGSYAHHLLDPSTGEPAWTGVVSATAIAPTALEAETLAKTAFLSGRAGARKVLAAHGGVTIGEGGQFEVHGALARPRASAVLSASSTDMQAARA